MYINGRTVLIGDAAHATVLYQGQGANQALEDIEGLNALLEDVVNCDAIPRALELRIVSVGHAPRRLNEIPVLRKRPSPREARVRPSLRSSYTLLCHKRLRNFVHKAQSAAIELLYSALCFARELTVFLLTPVLSVACKFHYI